MAASLSVLADEECAKLLLEDAVIMDEESGSNRQLGFAFLYEVLQGRVTLQLLGQDVSPSLGDLLTRYAHLKSARWGRETAESGEVEAAPSRHFAQLACLMNHPKDTQWPQLPADGTSAA